MKEAILIVSFGTTHLDTLEKTICAVERDIQAAFPQVPCFRAFTSPTVRRRLKERCNLDVDSVEQAMERLEADGFTHVTVQPTLLLPGEEYEKLRMAVQKNAGNMTARMGEPLLCEDSDLLFLVQCLRESYPLPEDTILLAMGHGTFHTADQMYVRLRKIMQQEGMELCTVEGTMGFEEAREALLTQSKRKVHLVPLLLVAGEHSRKDMAGDDPDSLKNRLTEVGFEVTFSLRGLEELEPVRKAYCTRTAKIRTGGDTMEKLDVVALGELLIDFTANGTSDQGNGLFEACPGGAPCNVLAMLRKLDKSCAFIGKVGDDMFGKLLRDTIVAAGIHAEHLVMDANVPTTLAFVQTFSNGDRDFSFYRKPGADMMLTEDELPMETIRNARIFHFGTLSMTHPGVRAATQKAVEAAKFAGVLISFDPNLRPPLWENLEAARQQIDWGLSRCDILKIADNELEFMTGEADFYQGASILHNQYPNIQVLNVTAGAEGSYSFYGDDAPVYVPAFRLGGTIETTGAGDTFCASVLSYLLENGIAGLTAEDRKNMLRFANAAAYMVTTRKGAIRSMPERGEVEALLASN